MSETTYIGTQFAKPLQDDKIQQNTGTEELPHYELVDNPAPNTYKKYAEAAQWCNEYIYAHIEDKGEYYELVGDPIPPEPTPEEIAEREKAEALAQAKCERAEAVSRLTVTVDGMVFDADETSQNRMSRVVAGAQALGIDQSTTQVWVLADNTVATPTVAQLAQALKLAGEAQTALWTVPYQSDTDTTETETNTTGE
nr:MAG TPA: protein of unknown function DUF4376 [Caudoviricetes sp.]